jgi:hypothetical protein
MLRDDEDMYNCELNIYFYNRAVAVHIRIEISTFTRDQLCYRHGSGRKGLYQHRTRSCLLIIL